jgi:hypothetical protein
MRFVRAVPLTAALLAASCGTPLMTLPSGTGVPSADAARALEQATAACSRVSTISAEVGVSGSVGGRRLRGRLLAGLAAPASAYMEAPAPFGSPVFIFAAENGSATLLLPRDRRVLSNGDPAEILEAIAGVPLDAAELRAAMTGCTGGTTVNAADAHAIGDEWRVVPGERQLYIRRSRPADPWRLVAVVRSGAPGWRADYREFVDDLPRSIRLTSLEARRFDLRLELSQVEINVPLEASTFRIAIPAGTQPLTLDELRAGGPLAR